MRLLVQYPLMSFTELPKTGVLETQFPVIMPEIRRALEGQPRLEVGRSIIWYGGKILLLMRVGTHFSGMWELPGGKKENGSDLLATAVREVEEETGLQGNFSPDRPRAFLIEEEVPEKQLLHVMRFDKNNPMMPGTPYDGAMVVTHISQIHAFTDTVMIEPESHSQFLWIEPEVALTLFGDELTPYTRFAIEAVVAQKRHEDFSTQRLEMIPEWAEMSAVQTEAVR